MAKIRATKQINWDGTIDLGSQVITTTATPGAAGHLTPRSYVDSAVSTALSTAQSYADGIAQGLDVKQSVKAASTANVSISAPGASLDGVTLVSGDRILLKDQTTQAENGIYIWTGASSALTRSLDFNAWTEIPGAFTFVEQGTANADKGFTCTSDQGGTLGTTNITWVLFSSAGSYTAGAGLTLSGSQFSVSLSAASGLSTTSGLAIVAADSTINVSASGIKVVDIPNSIVTPAKLGGVAGNGLTGGSGVALSVLVNGSTMNVSSSGIKVADGGITATQIAASAIGNGLAGGAGTALNVKLDSTTLAASASGVKVADAGITATQIATSALGDGMSGGGGQAITLNIDPSVFQISADLKSAPDGQQRKYLQLKGGSIDGTYIAQSAVPLWANMIIAQVPSGTVDDSNKAFTLANTPRTGSVKLYINGVRQIPTTDFTVSGTTITMVVAPTAGDVIFADYYK